MGPFDAIKTCLAKSFQFKGRASRSEFWWCAGPTYLLTAILIFTSDENYIQQFWEAALTAAFYFPFFGLTLLLAIGFRRLQDAGIAGFWWPLLMFLGTFYYQYIFIAEWPLESIFIVLIIFLTPLLILSTAIMAGLPSEPGTNRFGPNPNEVPQ